MWPHNHADQAAKGSELIICHANPIEQGNIGHTIPFLIRVTPVTTSNFQKQERSVTVAYFREPATFVTKLLSGKRPQHTKQTLFDLGKAVATKCFPKPGTSVTKVNFRCNTGHKIPLSKITPRGLPKNHVFVTYLGQSGNKNVFSETRNIGHKITFSKIIPQCFPKTIFLLPILVKAVTKTCFLKEIHSASPKPCFCYLSWSKR